MASYSKTVEDLRATFNSGRTRDVKWRKEQLKALLRLLDDQRDQIIRVLKEDLHKSAMESLVMEVDFSRNELIHALDHLSDWAKPEKVGRDLLTFADDAFIQREPLGVVLIIGAWNYPIQLTLGPMIGALAAGNCVILKPSEVSENTAKFLEEVFPRYLDKECIRLINGGVPETTALLKEKFDHIFYTGNPQVAKIIYEAAAKHLTPVTLELGGKSPAYVDSSSDLSVVARRLIWGKFANAGQTCIAPDYVMCTQDLQSPLVNKFRETLREFYGDNPESSDSLGHIVNSRHFNRVKGLMSGGQLQVGGRTNEKTNFIEPTIYSDVKLTDPIMQEEIFGPLLPVVPVKDVDEAISIINSREKPLAMYIFSKNKKVVDRILSSTSSGGVTVNDTLMHLSLPTLPFGGVGNSGFGNYHGKFSFETFSHKRGCLVRAQALEKLNDVRYPPYTPKKLSIISWITRKSPKSGSGFFFAFLPFIVIGILLGVLAKVIGLGGFFSRDKSSSN